LGSPIRSDEILEQSAHIRQLRRTKARFAQNSTAEGVVRGDQQSVEQVLRHLVSPIDLAMQAWQIATDFLHKLAKSGCAYLVGILGQHDSSCRK